MTFPYFPTPIADELAYSMLARYGQNIGLRRTRPLLRFVFGDCDRILATLPKRLRKFSLAVFGPAADPRWLVEAHTPYPYLSAFLPEGAREGLMLALLDGGEGSITRTGSVGTTRHDHLAFCPECVISDICEHGQSAWRRGHQLPGVFVCWKHEIPLRLGSARSFADHLVPCTDDPSSGIELVCPLASDLALTVARESAWLLSSDTKPFETHVLRATLRRLITQDGWSAGRGRVSSAFVEHVTSRGAASVGLLPGVISIRERARTVAPLVVILMMAAIGIPLRRLSAAMEETIEGKSKAAARPSDVPGTSGRGKTVTPERTAAFREKLLAGLAANPGASRTELSRRIAVKACRYLAKNDADWLQEHMPATRAYDWPVIDRELERAVSQAIARLLSSSGRTKRVTVASIIQEVGGSRIRNIKRDHLPLTWTAIDGAVGTSEAFASRRSG